ncbi:MAG: hypothetical protein ACK443_06765 [Methylococcaceae bacterium]|jgi:hypothetical protein
MPFHLHLRHLCILVCLTLAKAAEAESYPSEDCRSTDTATLWLSPARPLPGEPLKVMAVLTEGAADHLSIIRADGRTVPIRTKTLSGPPHSLYGEIGSAPAGEYRITVAHEGETLACRKVGDGALVAPPEDWNPQVEAFFSAWIEQLFDAPMDESLSFSSLEPVLRNRDRNMLYNHLGTNEDVRLPAQPDCADLPYFLRAYFAWKLGLPVSFRACDRGTASRPPRCGSPNLDDRFSRGSQTAGSFNSLMRQIADTVHSGSARTALNSDATDFYPVALERASLRPGTVYADPYGHTLIIAKWIPQSASTPGLLLAVDAQPDNSVTRKRFWEGNFLFANSPGAGPGFKAFRPLLRSEGRLGLPSNSRLAVNAPSALYSDQQEGLAAEDFYAEMGSIMNPQGLAPEAAYDAMMDALVEQIETRVTAIDNGESYLRQHRGGVISMPSGAAIFQTTGPWEDYATPSRDMRLLIAMNVIAALPERIVRYPKWFALSGRAPDEARAAIEARHAEASATRRFSYTRSDGSPWQLSVADLIARRSALEVGYNPNACVESRWGAPAESSEYETCRRHPSPEQTQRMENYRIWFRETRRPTQ